MRPAAARFAILPDGQAVGRTASGPDAVLIAPVVDEQSIGSLAAALEAEQHLVVLRHRDQEPIIIPTGAALDARPEPAFEVRCSDESNRNRGAIQAAAANGVGWTSLAGTAGYQVVNRSWSVPSRVRVRVCRSRGTPFFDHCICCFLAKRLLTTRSTSAKAVEMISPWSQHKQLLRLDWSF